MTNKQAVDTIEEKPKRHGSPIRTAVILAAGKGVRLKERGELTGWSDHKFDLQAV